MLVKRIASIFKCLRAIARYWWEIATFPYPLHLSPPPVGVFPLEFREKVWSSDDQKTRIMGLPGSEDSLTIDCAVLTQYQRDGQTDGRRDGQPISIINVRSNTDAR